MSNKLYEETDIQDIADAIREKSGASDTYTVAEMGDAIRTIPSNVEEIYVGSGEMPEGVVLQFNLDESIMRVKQSDDTIVDVPIGKAADGVDGKSAYDYAKEAGYTGTEAEFMEAINPDNHYTKAEVDGLIPDVSEQVGAHNTSTDAHNDIRTEIAEQSVELKRLIDAIVVPTQLSQLEDDSNHRLVTDTEKNNWNNKANVSDIPTAVSDLENDLKFLTAVPDTYYTSEQVDALIPDISNLAEKSEIPTVPMNVSAFINDSQYTTETELSEKGYIPAIFNAEGDIIRVNTSTDAPLKGLVVTGKTTNVNNVVTKNLLPFPYVSGDIASDGVTVENILTGEYSGKIRVNLSDEAILTSYTLGVVTLPAGTYVASINNISGYTQDHNQLLAVYDENNQELDDSAKFNDQWFTLNKEQTVRLTFTLSPYVSGAYMTDGIYEFQLERVEIEDDMSTPTATEWEPYVTRVGGASIIVTVSDSDNVQSSTLTLEHELTNVNGVYDEINFNTGKIIHRTGYENDTYIVLDSPVEQDIPSDTLELFNSIQGYTPGMIITNDCSGYMIVNYVPSLQTYIDRVASADGKSAYEFAQDGGYTGSESDFAKKLATEIPTAVSQLTNDSGYLIEVPNTYWNKTQTTDAINIAISNQNIPDPATLATPEYVAQKIAEAQLANGTVDMSAYATRSFVMSSGNNTVASGTSAVAHGNATVASGNYSHAEGGKTLDMFEIEVDTDVTTEGKETIYGPYTSGASGVYSHSEGQDTMAQGPRSHSEGYKTVALGEGSHAEGIETIVDLGINPETGERSNVFSRGAHAEGYQTVANNIFAHAEGYITVSSGQSSHAEGSRTTASGNHSHAEGHSTTASGEDTHCEGRNTTASGFAAHSEGQLTIAEGTAAHAEGLSTKAFANCTHAEGWYANASGEASHAEGYGTLASGKHSHAEGAITVLEYQDSTGVARTPGSYGEQAHTEGINTTAEGKHAHAEGNASTAVGVGAHAEGHYATAIGDYSHSEGERTVASGNYSHAGGAYTIASATAQTAIGKYNKLNANALFIVGNGTDVSDDKRTNAFEVLADGTATVMSTNENNLNSVVTVEYLQSVIAELRAEIEALKNNN